MTRIGITVDGEWLWGKLNDSLENAPTIEPEPSWIPVTDRMPKREGEYLVSDIFRNVYKSSYGYDRGNQYIWHRFVKAWMPLPEPYREGE